MRFSNSLLTNFCLAAIGHVFQKNVNILLLKVQILSKYSNNLYNFSIYNLVICSIDLYRLFNKYSNII
ncbi:hypothetical protein NQ314_014162 [Rhamnusium bicolor]|uniref:Uncharacterized protein n=1 Tax=Rhamnusium bicolor TaxID=1586634 RepID=A0AAV8X4B5_9CUCU|nr:hypothetical protein NQ314_014162 [Rhamnusium bicolor]